MNKLCVWLGICVIVLVAPSGYGAQRRDDDLTPFQTEGFRWGFKDKSGRVIIQPQFEFAKPFSEGLAVVMLGGSYGFIDETGQLVIRPQFYNADPFSEGLAPVMLHGGWGYIDVTGQTVIAPQFDVVRGFAEGLAAVAIGDRWGFINKDGQLVIRPQFGQVSDFSDGHASVRLGDADGDIDRTGRFTSNPSHTPGHKLTRGLTNAVLGWVEAPKSFLRCCREPILGTMGGPPGIVVAPLCLGGAVYGAAYREVWGVIEVVTFPVPWPKWYYASPYRWFRSGDSP